MALIIELNFQRRGKLTCTQYVTPSSHPYYFLHYEHITCGPLPGVGATGDRANSRHDSELIFLVLLRFFFFCIKETSEGKKEKNIWSHQMRTRLCKCCSFIYLFLWCVYLMCVLMCAARQRSVCLCECPMCFFSFFLSTELSITQPHSSPANPVVLLPVGVGADLRRARAFRCLLRPKVSVITGVLMHSVNRMGFFFFCSAQAGAG